LAGFRRGLAGYFDIRDKAVDNINIDNAIEFTFEDAGHYDDASMGITDPTAEREPFKLIPLIELDGPQRHQSEPGSTARRTDLCGPARCPPTRRL